MKQVKDKDNNKKEDEKVSKPNEVVEADLRFPDDKKDDKKDDGEKGKEKVKRKFGDDKHKEDIRKENRLKARYGVVNKLKGIVPDSIFGVLQGIGRVLDYVLNLITIVAIVYCIYIGAVEALPSGEWIKVACAAVLIVVIAWVSEKIS